MKMMKWFKCLSIGLFAACAAHGADLAFLKELVEIPSSSIDYPQVNRAMRAMKAYLEARGLFCTVETDDKGRDEWRYDLKSPSCRILEKTPRTRVAEVIDELMESAGRK